MACVEPNVLTFMGDHWFLTLILALIVGHYILRPVGTLVLAVALRLLRR